MNKFHWGIRTGGIFLTWALMAAALPAQTFTTLHNFTGKNGITPYAGLLQATDGNLYGTTTATVFQITPSGTLTTLHNFCHPKNDCPEGSFLFAGLIQGADGNLYGTARWGGTRSCEAEGGGCGTVFKISLSGTLTTLHNFCSRSGCPDGDNPLAGLVQGADGNFYGTTSAGGTNHDGTIFKITPSGKLTTIYNFCSQSNCTDGYSSAGLIQVADGNFYGTTEYGGANADGTVFKITPKGKLTTLYSFCSKASCADGQQPRAALVQGADGNFYGTTYYGGIYSSVCTYNTCGTVFKITPGGILTTLYSFQGTDGFGPLAALVQATDGNFYGTTYYGGFNGDGTIFQISPTGTLATLHSFGETDGIGPWAGLIQDTDGTLYGTTQYGGASNYGTVFSLSMGLGPFVETQSASGPTEAPVTILGTNLTGATSVTFNGTAATFTVVSSSEITATVPGGATTGTVQVVTPGATLSSNMPFTVD
jgi:uncharacterized repeat protein (TIGR03803 family)